MSQTVEYIPASPLKAAPIFVALDGFDELVTVDITPLPAAQDLLQNIVIDTLALMLYS